MAQLNAALYGMVPGASAAKNGVAIEAALTACRAANADLFIPDGTYDVDHTIFFGTASKKPVALKGNGGVRIRRGAGWADPVPGQGSHLAVWDKCATSFVDGVSFDGNAIAYKNRPNFMGDTVRAQYITASVWHNNMHTYNNVGRTTTTSATQAETFSNQYLRCTAPVLVSNCNAIQEDGSQGATGMVSHICDNVTFANCTVAGFTIGQGFGTFGSTTTATSKVTFLNCHAYFCKNGFNIEAGPGGINTVTIGNVTDTAQACTSNSCTRGFLSNGNFNYTVKTINVYDLTINSCGDGISMTGLAPTKLTFTRTKVVSPTVCAVHFLTNQGPNAASMYLVKSTLHNNLNVPVVVGNGGVLAANHGTFTLV